jgi:hypothetical protein
MRAGEVTDWTPADIVLDVPDQATELHFGTLLNGAGPSTRQPPASPGLSEISG